MKKSIYPISGDKLKTRSFFGTFDIECDDWTKFIVAGVFYKNKYRELFSRDAVFLYFYFQDEKSEFFSHYGGGYDFLFLISVFLENGIIPYDILMRGGTILSFKIKNRYGKIINFVDSFGLLCSSFEKLAVAFDVEYKKLEINYKNLVYSKQLSEYLRHDVIGLHQILTKFFNIEIIRKAGFALTVASQSQKVLRTFLKKPIYSIPVAVDEMCRRALHGGRTEIFKFKYTKTKNNNNYLKVLDVKSLYPYICAHFLFPDGRAIFTTKFIKDKLGYYDCIVECSENMKIPFLPIKKDNKLLYPVGKFEGTYFSEEIKYALELGYKIKIIRGYFFTKSADYFSEMMNLGYNLKEAKGTVGEIWKYFINNVWGRLVLKLYREEIILSSLPEKGFISKNIFFETPKGKIEVFGKEKKLDTATQSAIGAAVPAYAGIYLHKKMMSIPYESLYACDTDSIFTDCDDSIIEKSSKKMGDWDLQGLYKEALFVAPKNYVLTKEDNEIILKTKGISLKNISDFDLTKKQIKKDIYDKVMNGESIEIPQTGGVFKFKTAMKKGDIFLKKENFNKKITFNCDKRNFNLKNNKTWPIKVELAN